MLCGALCVHRQLLLACKIDTRGVTTAWHFHWTTRPSTTSSGHTCETHSSIAALTLKTKSTASCVSGCLDPSSTYCCHYHCLYCQPQCLHHTPAAPHSPTSCEFLGPCFCQPPHTQQRGPHCAVSRCGSAAAGVAPRGSPGKPRGGRGGSRCRCRTYGGGQGSIMCVCGSSSNNNNNKNSAKGCWTGVGCLRTVCLMGFSLAAYSVGKAGMGVNVLSTDSIYTREPVTCTSRQ